MVHDQKRLAHLFLRLMSVARHRFIAELVLWFLLVWFGCALGVYLLESGTNPKLRSPADAVYALLVTMTTSGDAAVGPTSAAGRWVMSVALLASKLLTALLCALAAAVLIERKVREDMGLKMYDLHDHVLIIGWNFKGPHILKGLRHDAALAAKHVVIMAEGESKPSDDPLTHWTRSCLPIRGEAIERACVATAGRVIILANYAEKTHADALTALSCLMVRQLNPQASITVELLDPTQRPYMEAAGATQVVGIGEVGGYLLAEAAVGHPQTREFLAALSSRAQAAMQPAPVRPSAGAPAGANDQPSARTTA